MEQALGVYVSVSANGRIKRNLTPKNGEVKLKVSTITNEIIDFSELNFQPYAEVVDKLDEMFADTFLDATDKEHFGETFIAVERFGEAMQLVHGLLDALEEDNVLNGTLTRLMLENAVPPDDGSAWWMIQTGQAIIDRLSSIMQLQFLVNQALYDIRNGTPLDLDDKYAFFSRAEFPQIYMLGKKLTAQYRFRSPIEYTVF